MDKHKRLGQVYTPNFIVNHILDAVGYVGCDIIEKKILEPSCGNGAFLTEIVNRLINEGKNTGYDDLKIFEILENNITGIEIDESALTECKSLLDALIRQKLNIDLKVNWNLILGNTLYLYKNHLNQFDYVVGNPPYIRIHNLDLALRDYIKREFSFAEGTIDIYISFYELGLKCLKPTGVLGYITPNSFIHNTSYQKFRFFLAHHKYISQLIDFKSNKIFSGFSTYTSIAILSKYNRNRGFDYSEFIDEKIKKINYIKFDDLNPKRWCFTSSANEDFLFNINKDKGAQLGEHFEVQYGFATLRDSVFIAKSEKVSNTENVIFNGEIIETRILKKIIKGSTYKGFNHQIIDIIFPYKNILGRWMPLSEVELAEQFPLAYRYLLKNKEELLTRDLDKGAQWFEFGRSQGIQTIHQPKLICSTMFKDSIPFYQVDANVMVYSGIFIISKTKHYSLQALKKILESAKFYKYAFLSGKDFSGGYKSLNTKLLKAYSIDVATPELTLFS